MGRVFKRILALSVLLPVLFCFACSVRASAYTEETEDVPKELLDDFFDILPEGIDEGDIKEGLADSLGVEALLSELLNTALGRSGQVTRFFLTCLGLALLLALSELISYGGGLAKGVIAAAAAVTLYGFILPLVNEATEALSAVSEFFGAASAVVSSLTLAAGGGGTAAAQAVGMNLTLSLFGSFGGGFLSSVVSALFAIGTVCALNGSEGGSGKGTLAIASGVRSVFTWGIGLLSACLMGLLSLQKTVAAASDSAALRAAKYAASGMIPVVGGAVSSALSTLTSGLGYAASVVGGGAVLVILTLCLSPLVVILLYRLALFPVLVLLDFAGGGAAKRCFLGLRSALDALLSVYVLTCIVYIFEIIMYLKGGVFAL